MKTLLFVIGVLALSAKVQSAVVAVEGDFVVDCGTDPLGMVSITYTNSDPTNNIVAAMSSPKGRETCATSTVTAGTMVISDARTNCDIVQPDANKPEFWLQISLQEFIDVYQQTDPTFLFKCSYKVNDVPVSSVTIDAGNVGVPTTVAVTATGDPDMTYTLTLIDPATNTELTAAQFGDNVALRISMSGTDADEQGVRVKSCTATSGTVSLPIIENFCVVAGKEALFQLNGFASAGTQASFPMTVFALAGSTESTVQFQCVAEVCPEACDGLNCQTARKRKRRESESEPKPTEEKVLTMVTRLQIIPESGSPSGQLGNGNNSSLDSCTQSLAFIITVGVLAVLLLVAMVAVFFMFTTRRRELQKQGA